MNDILEGIVLRQSEYKDNDLLLNVFLKEHGKISLVVKGGLKENSKNKALCAPFSCSQFQIDYSPLKSIFLLKTGSLQHSFYKIKDNLDLISCANLMVEILEQFIEPQVQNENFYNLFLFCLTKLHEKKNIYLVLAFYISECLKEIGIEPEVDECVNCSELKVNTISIAEGGFVCLKCATNTKSMKCDLDALKNFRYICKAGFEQFSILETNCNVRLADVSVFVEFLIFHTGIRLRNWQVFKDWTS